MGQRGQIAFGNVIAAINQRLPLSTIKSMLKEVIVEDPTYFRAYAFLGQTQASEGQYEKALANLDEAIRLIKHYAADEEDMLQEKVVSMACKLCPLFALKRFDEVIGCSTEIIDISEKHLEVTSKSAIYNAYVQAYLARSLSRQCQAWGDPESTLTTNLYLADFNKAKELDAKAEEDFFSVFFVTLYRTPGFPPQLKAIYLNVFDVIESVGVSAARTYFQEKTNQEEQSKLPVQAFESPAKLTEKLKQYFSDISDD